MKWRNSSWWQSAVARRSLWFIWEKLIDSLTLSEQCFAVGAARRTPLDALKEHVSSMEVLAGVPCSSIQELLCFHLSSLPGQYSQWPRAGSWHFMAKNRAFQISSSICLPTLWRMPYDKAFWFNRAFAQRHCKVHGTQLLLVAWLMQDLHWVIYDSYECLLQHSTVYALINSFEALLDWVERCG